MILFHSAVGTQTLRRVGQSAALASAKTKSAVMNTIARWARIWIKYLVESSLAVLLVYVTPSLLNLSKNPHFFQINEVIPIVLIVSSYFALKRPALLQYFVGALTVVVVWMVGIANDQLENVALSVLASGITVPANIVVGLVLVCVVADLLYVANSFTLMRAGISMKPGKSAALGNRPLKEWIDLANEVLPSLLKRQGVTGQQVKPLGERVQSWVEAEKHGWTKGQFLQELGKHLPD